MCQPRFFSPFLLYSLRLAARSEPAELSAWLSAFDLQEIEAPCTDLIAALRKHDASAMSLLPTDPPSALEKAIASSMCSCAVDPEQALTELGAAFDPETRSRVALCLEAIGLALNTHAARIQRAWAVPNNQRRIGTRSTAVC